MHFKITYLQNLTLRLFLSCCFILSLSCKKETEPSYILPEPIASQIAGKWNVSLGEEAEPQSLVLEIFPQDKKALWKSQELELIFDSLGMKVMPRDTEFPLAFFLYNELGKKVWVGTWEDRLVRLTRH